jgi:hypothetical protein
MSEDTQTLEIEVSSEQIIEEIGYGIWGRAMDVNDNPDDEHADTAKELVQIAHDLTDYHPE